MKLIIIDGLDGSGKSTQAHIIYKLLKQMNKQVSIRVHPESDNWFGRNTHTLLNSKGKSAHFSSALLYMLDVVRSILLYSWRKDDYIIFVRYLMGTAYLPSPLHSIGYNFFSAIVPKSNKMFFLDVNPKVAASRIMDNRTNIEMFENLDSLKKVRAKALALTRFDDWTIIDSNQLTEAVTSNLRTHLAK